MFRSVSGPGAPISSRRRRIRASRQRLGRREAADRPAGNERGCRRASAGVGRALPSRGYPAGATRTRRVLTHRRPRGQPSDTPCHAAGENRLLSAHGRPPPWDEPELRSAGARSSQTSRRDPTYALGQAFRTQARSRWGVAAQRTERRHRTEQTPHAASQGAGVEQAAKPTRLSASRPSWWLARGDKSGDASDGGMADRAIARLVRRQRA